MVSGCLYQKRGWASRERRVVAPSAPPVPPRTNSGEDGGVGMGDPAKNDKCETGAGTTGASCASAPPAVGGGQRNLSGPTAPCPFRYQLAVPRACRRIPRHSGSGSRRAWPGLEGGGVRSLLYVATHRTVSCTSSGICCRIVQLVRRAPYGLRPTRPPKPCRMVPCNFLLVEESGDDHDIESSVDATGFSRYTPSS